MVTSMTNLFSVFESEGKNSLCFVILIIIATACTGFRNDFCFRGNLVQLTVIQNTDIRAQIMLTALKQGRHISDRLGVQLYIHYLSQGWNTTKNKCRADTLDKRFSHSTRLGAKNVLQRQLKNFNAS